MNASAVLAGAASGIVAGVFSVSAWSKLRDRVATRDAFERLHLPAGSGDSLAIIEAFTALGLVVERRTAWSAVVAIALVSGFTVFVGVRTVRGERTPCPCFGASSAPMGWSTVARNVVLLAVAVVATASRAGAAWVPPLAATVVMVSARLRSRSVGGAGRSRGA